MIQLEGGPLDGYPLVAWQRPDELHLPFTDEMARLSSQMMTAVRIDVTERPDSTQLATARGVAIYARHESQPSDSSTEEPPVGAPPIAAYVFRESLTPSEYAKRYRAEGRR
jgi:hypothetical protein